MWAIALSSFRRFGINRIADDMITLSQRLPAQPLTTEEAERRIKKDMETWHKLWKREQKKRGGNTR